MNKFMKIAIKEGRKGMDLNHGGPFGAVIVKDGNIIAKAHNTVLLNNNPIQHAEMNAIQKASKKLNRFDLGDCELYTSCCPCPMCFSAIHWAKIRKVFYAGTASDAAWIGFDDKDIYDILKGDLTNPINMEKIDQAENTILFNDFRNKNDKKMY